MMCRATVWFVFFFNDTATTEIYTLSLHDALPILSYMLGFGAPIPMGWLNVALLVLATPVQFWAGRRFYRGAWGALRHGGADMNTLVVVGTSAAYLYSRSEEHTSELQSRQYLVCRLLLEKKNYSTKYTS